MGKRSAASELPRDGATPESESQGSIREEVTYGCQALRSPSSEHSRARNPYSEEQKQQLLQADGVAGRVEIIFEWMIRGWYTPGSDKHVAQVLGITPDAVRSYSAEARRRLVRELLGKSRDELLAELMTRIAHIGQNALDRTEEVALQSGQVVEVRKPDHRTALRAAEATGELLGLKVQRHHHTIGADQMTTEQLVEQLRAHGVRVELPALPAPETTETTGETITEESNAEREPETKP